jgi:hypothetical protein
LLTNKNKGFAYRIAKFLRRLSLRAKTQYPGLTDEAHKARCQYFRELFPYVFSHYTQKECPSQCPCNEHYGPKAAADIRKVDLKKSFSENEAIAARARAHEDVNEGDLDAITKADISFTHLAAGLLEDSNLEDAEACKAVEIAAEKAAEENVCEILVGEEVPDNSEPGMVKIRRVSKKYFNLENKKDLASWRKIVAVLERFEDSCEMILFAVDTCMSENSNRRRIVFLPKDKVFLRTYQVRSLLSAMLEIFARAQLYEMILAHLNLPLDDSDLTVLQVFHSVDSKKEYHSDRKKVQALHCGCSSLLLTKFNTMLTISMQRILEKISMTRHIQSCTRRLEISLGLQSLASQQEAKVS